MNTKALQAVKTLLGETIPQDFDMKMIYNSETHTRCVAGLIWEYLLPEEQKLSYDHRNLKNYLGIDSTSQYDEWDYLFHIGWAGHVHTNTIEHAQYRVQRLIDGYKPGNIYDEIINESKKTL